MLTPDLEYFIVSVDVDIRNVKFLFKKIYNCLVE